MKTLVALSFLVATSVLALTPQERRIVIHAQSALHEGQKQLSDAQWQIAQSDAQAAMAAAHAHDTDVAADELQKQIDISHANEQKLADKNAILQPFWDKAHAHWGIGAIGIGLKILFTHLIILAAVLVALAVLGFLGYIALSFMAPGAAKAIDLGWTFLMNLLPHKK